jgi:hypothetical protein
VSCNSNVARRSCLPQSRLEETRLQDTSALAVSGPQQPKPASAHAAVTGACSMLDAICASIATLASGSFLELLDSSASAAQDCEADQSTAQQAIAAVLSVFQAMSVIIRHVAICPKPASILFGQPGFWRHLTDIAGECMAQGDDTQAAQEQLHVLLYILDCAAHALYELRDDPPDDLVALVRTLFEGAQGSSRASGCVALLCGAAGTQRLAGTQRAGRAAAVNAGQVAALGVRSPARPNWQTLCCRHYADCTSRTP